MDSLKGFLDNNETRFQNWEFPNGSVANRLGYFNKDMVLSQTIYYVNQQLFKKEFCKNYLGIGYNLVRDVLIKNHILETEANGTNKRIKLLNGKQNRMVCLNIKND